MKLSSALVLSICVLFCTAGAILSSAQTLATYANFTQSNGAYPASALVLGSDGNFYGTTASGGFRNSGTVFKMTPNGSLTTLYSFCIQASCADGSNPYARLVQGTDGNFYGTTQNGGAHVKGTVFKITPSGSLTTLYSFCGQGACADGANPHAGLVQAGDGNFYGTTISGPQNTGTVFRITPDGTLTNLHSFCSQPNCANGNSPYAALLLASDGVLYGTTSAQGSTLGGTVFKITLAGDFTNLYTFCAPMNCTDGANSSAELVEGTDGNFYGTTRQGGIYGPGTIFSITPSGTLTTLYSFCAQLPSCPDGAFPYGGLLLAGDGSFYSTTELGGAANRGTIFKISPGGAFTQLYSLGSQDGSQPLAALVLAPNGSFYGTTQFGGLGSAGTVFNFSVLPSLTIFMPTIGPPGRIVAISGQNLTGATSVTFGGVAATDFTVDSKTHIHATVPPGAKTGKIGVTTPLGSALSNGIFKVI